MGEKRLYKYEGPVFNNFGTIIDNLWKEGTQASSFGEAKRNLLFNCKRQHGYERTAKLSIDLSKIQLAE